MFVANEYLNPFASKWVLGVKNATLHQGTSTSHEMFARKPAGPTPVLGSHTEAKLSRFRRGVD